MVKVGFSGGGRAECAASPAEDPPEASSSSVPRPTVTLPKTMRGLGASAFAVAEKTTSPPPFSSSNASAGAIAPKTGIGGGLGWDIEGAKWCSIDCRWMYRDDARNPTLQCWVCKVQRTPDLPV